MAKISLNVNGMSCSACVSSVKSALRGVSGVDDVHVDLLAHQVHVTFDEERAQPSQLTTALQAAGYDVLAGPAPARRGGSCCG